MKEEAFKEFARAAGELAKAADALGMSKYRLTVTPKDFIILQEQALKAQDISAWSARTISMLPVEVKW